MSTSASRPFTSIRRSSLSASEAAAIFGGPFRSIGEVGRVKASIPPLPSDQVGDPDLRLDVLDDDVAWTLEQVCGYFGGLKPINPATIYTWIKEKGFPEPFKPGPQTSRWLKSEVVAYRRNMILGRGKTPPVPTGKRKKRP
jgi:predicted DNA-binding transcriptional regulator AlpA